MSHYEEDGMNWCFDFDAICSLPVQDYPKIEDGPYDPPVARSPVRDRPFGSSLKDVEGQKRRNSGRSRSKSPGRNNRGGNSAGRNSRGGSSANPSKRPSNNKSFGGLPFVPSFTGEKKKKPMSSIVTTKLDATKEEQSKDSAAAGDTDAETDVEDTYPRGYKGRKVQANVFMISGCEDSQTSADVSNVSSFSLPNPNGRAGGACTSALLKVLYANKKQETNLTFVQVLGKMRKILRNGRYSQIPQLTSSREMDMAQKFYIVPPNCTGTKRAVLIGINYVGQNGELSGCHNDCLNMKDYIMNVWGFKEENITVLMDDQYHTQPTRSNILAAYQELAAYCKDGDAAFCHYSGHGGRVRDDDWGEEEDGYDETLVPVDYQESGQIRDDDLYTNLVCALSSGVTLFSLMDCCHSATVLDLPYKYRPNGTGESYTLDPLTLDGGNAMITAFLCAVVIVILVVLLPIMLTQN